MDDAPPGRHGNDDADKLPGNPDIRVPERVERENGLRAPGAERQENADRGERRRDERLEDRGRRLNTGEILEAKDQGRIETKRRPEGRGLRHVPVGTWLNKGSRELKQLPHIMEKCQGLTLAMLARSVKILSE
ncbi:hypothetical protein NDU88_005140 [Pleurodeles waltl]|uniref:Uncharacterized protein n=1 Tax=Pleurodeles waltl TaxID=8319 RepID=A0AAV7WXT9_PLEWA|nr:hypothetical protein NDU88_005140 [Pleurodeles waltl]